LPQTGFKVIPRGGGTGLTGGSVPLENGCVIVNTEQLNRIHGIETHEMPTPDRSNRQVAVIHLESGVITDAAMAYARLNRDWCLPRTPPAPGPAPSAAISPKTPAAKPPCLWGTAIDNLSVFLHRHARWPIVHGPCGDHIPCSASCPKTGSDFDIADDTGRAHSIGRPWRLQIRQAGLGKDITNKALSGLPGIQKEGTDGIITSARFILHRAYPEKVTCCLEFFGTDMDEASRAIAAICEAFANHGEETLMALEHFDDAYVRAIGYKVKAPRQDLPKAVLLVDMVGHTGMQIQRGLARLDALMTGYPNTHLFVAENEQEARHVSGATANGWAPSPGGPNPSNSTKTSSCPSPPWPSLPSLPTTSTPRSSAKTRQALVFRLGAHLETAQPLEDPEWLAAKLPAAKRLLMAALDTHPLAGKHHLQEETTSGSS
jgi:FAD/FMN-containing dehydrogenase